MRNPHAHCLAIHTALTRSIRRCTLARILAAHLVRTRRQANSTARANAFALVVCICTYSAIRRPVPVALSSRLGRPPFPPCDHPHFTRLPPPCPPRCLRFRCRTFGLMRRNVALYRHRPAGRSRAAVSHTAQLCVLTASASPGFISVCYSPRNSPCTSVLLPFTPLRSEHHFPLAKDLKWSHLFTFFLSKHILCKIEHCSMCIHQV
ncbi:hypothetical protein C8R45DRAFT_1038839 [Mycena sanguinolenta]|nr:hypothetical protein C8R45DRAFT_1038839 [Mycena sanguinolenta]